MTERTPTITDLAATALEASWPALTALETDVAPHVDGAADDAADELMDSIAIRDIFGTGLMELPELVLDDLAERILEGSTRTTRHDTYSVIGGSWIETSRTEAAEGFARATAVLIDFQQALRAVHDRVEAERAMVRLLAAG